MKNTATATVTTTALLALAALLAGCSESAQYVDSKGTDTIVSIDRVDIQDFSMAADNLLQSLYDSPAFTNSPRKPPILAINRVTNDTTTQFDTDMLLQKIRISVTNSGKAEVSTVMGPGGRVDDEMARDAKVASGHAAVNQNPDYTLIGKIMEAKTSAGRTKQTTYIFQLTLTRVSTGTIAWAGEKEITKQGTKSAVGW